MEFFLSGSLPLIEFVICDVMGDMANKLLSLSLCVCPECHWNKKYSSRGRTYTHAVDRRDEYYSQFEHAEYEADDRRAETFLNCLHIETNKHVDR